MSTAASRRSLAIVALLAVTLPPTARRFVAEPDTAFAAPDSVDDELSYVTGMAVDADGSIFVADLRLPHVLQLDSLGGVRRFIGRSGGGPGEFVTPFLLGFYRDSLWVFDPGALRITFFPRSGTGVGTLPLDALRTPTAGGRIQRVHSGAPLAMQPDGLLLMLENVAASENAADGYRQALVLSADRSLLVRDTLAALSAVHSVCVFSWRDGESHVPQPFGDDPLYAGSSDGQRFATVTRTAATSSGEQRFTVTMVSLKDHRSIKREFRYRPRPLPSRVVDSALARIGQDLLGNLSSPVTVDSLRRRLFLPAYYPPVTRLRLARDGTVWMSVRFADSPADATEWMVLSSHGFELRRVTTPGNFLLFEADRDVLWGVNLHADETMEVARLKVKRG
jgi:hypothetical protein